MEKIITGDGSETFYNPEFGDVYHSRSGALEESFGKYVKPCQLAETARKNGHLRILDIGFGLGYNACAAMHFIAKHAPETRLSIVSLEKDPEVLKLLGQVDPKLPEYELIRVLAHQADHKINKGNQTLELVFGEALQTISQLTGFFDVIFHDPFHPGKTLICGPPNFSRPNSACW